MAKIRTKNASTGMVVSKDVLDVSGRLLVPKGTCLKDQHLKVFQTWGVAEIDVESDDVAGSDHDDGNIPTKYLDAAALKVEKSLVANDRDHPLIKEIRSLAVRKVALDLQKEDKA